MKITDIINKSFSGINKIFHLTKYAIITYIERIYLLLTGVKIKEGGILWLVLFFPQERLSN